MKTVQVFIAGIEGSRVTGKGPTLAAAVRNAAFQLFKRPGRSVSHERINSHEHLWLWSIGSKRFRKKYGLTVVENRSGPSGTNGSTRQVMLRLSDEDADRLDARAEKRGMNRSEFVLAMLDAEEK